MGFFKSMFGSTADVNKQVLDGIKSHLAEEGLVYVESYLINNIFGLGDKYRNCKMIYFLEDRLRVGGFAGGRDIEFKNIVNLEVLTDIQIQEKSKVGEMLLIGMFALATKKKTFEVEDRKILLTMNEDDIKFNVIIDSNSDELELAKTINKYRLL